MTIAILDHGSGNLRSAVRALVRAGAEVDLTDDPQRAERADGLVVPGVGAFAACMAGLRRIGAVDLVREWAATGRPLLGICVGYQVLFESGTEHGETTEGCGVLTGEVTALPARRLPHMGWNTVQAGPGGRFLVPSSTPGAAYGDLSTSLEDRGVRSSSGVETPDARYYFVHSYGVPAGQDVRLTSTGTPVTVHSSEHDGARFVAAVETGTLLATQFHPEKSADAGATLLRGWVSAVRNG